VPALTHGSKVLPVAIVPMGCRSPFALPGAAHAADILDGSTQNSGRSNKPTPTAKGTCR
jgi:hypothetical protein